MKIIFLDVDGVINTHMNVERLTSENDGVYDWNYNNSFDKECMIELKRIVSETKAHVVLHSARRFSDALMLPLRVQFADCGLINYLKDVTPKLTNADDLSLERQYAKESEILSWLYEHKDVERYVILDDVNVFEKLSENHILINPEIGINKENANRAIKILNT